MQIPNDWLCRPLASGWIAVPLLVSMAGLAVAAASPEDFRVLDAAPGRHGFTRHTIDSRFQGGPTSIEVRLPERLAAGERLATLYLLPVEAGEGTQWGDAREEAAKLDLANRLRVICVYPTFSHLPWYLDHPTDPGIRQETYFLKVIVPFVDSRFPARARKEDRWLLGFSKSGWGAWSLLLRNPGTFGKAAAWDAPLMLTRGHFGLETIAGTPENFERHRITRLLRGRGTLQGDQPRLYLAGYDNFREPVQQAHALLNELKIPHEYRDGPQQKHHWNSGWVEAAARWLAEGK